MTVFYFVGMAMVPVAGILFLMSRLNAGSYLRSSGNPLPKSTDARAARESSKHDRLEERYVEWFMKS